MTARARPALLAPWLALLVALAIVLAPAAARAQDYATLIADLVRVEGSSRLVAEGNVEVLHRGNRLQAAQVIYDRDADLLSIVGPIVLSDARGTVILADAAELSPDLRDGLLTSARMVLEQQLQLAANSIARASGRFTTLSRVVASSCQVCAANPVPLWEIRASRVVHDQLERQLYFDNASLRIAGVPVIYLPRLRLPDPTNQRAAGLLKPELRTTSLLGTGIKTPYFIPIGDHRDLTVTPYLTTSGARSVELRYRQAFRRGSIELGGTIARDDLLPDTTRGYVTAIGTFALPNDYRLSFDIEAVSDDAFLLDYGISDKDRLESSVTLDRTGRDRHFSAEVLNYHTIRAGESNDTLPYLVGDVTWQRRFSPALIGGEADLRLQALGLRRRSELGFDGPDADLLVDGRDVGRLSASLGWRRNWTLTGGVLAAALAEVSAEHFALTDDVALGSSVSRVTPAAAVELRWPLARSTPGGIVDVVEPVVQLVWSDAGDKAVPNEDSALVEFDEGNLFALSRFAGVDRREDGLRANLGLGWTRTTPAGWMLGVTAGRILRASEPRQFAPDSGLDGARSDWLAALRLEGPDGLSLLGRALFDGDFGLTMNETRLDWQGQVVDVAATLIYLTPDLAENRPDRSVELTVDAGYALTDTWTARANGRYDFAANEATRAGLGLVFRNECATIDLSLSRRFTASTNVKPTTDFALSIELAGFGGSRAAAGPSRHCGL